MIKTKSVDSASNWQPGSEGMGSGYVMPYTQGGYNPQGAQAATSLDPVAYLPGSEVPGNTDTGVTHSAGTIDTNPSKGA